MGQEQELRGEKADKGCSDEDQRHVEAKKQALLQGLDESIFSDSDVYFKPQRISNFLCNGCSNVHSKFHSINWTKISQQVNPDPMPDPMPVFLTSSGFNAALRVLQSAFLRSGTQRLPEASKGLSLS